MIDSPVAAVGDDAVADVGRAPMLREQAVVAFKRCLFEGGFRPGQFLSQRELTLLLDLPIAPIRDAIKRLESEGLVRVIPQRGVAIAEASVQLVRESFELRKALEAWATRRYAQTGPLEPIDALALAMRRMQAEAENELTQELLGRAILLDRMLHDTIVGALDNQLFTDVTRQTFDKIQLIRLVRPVTPDRLCVAFEEHADILEALLARDAERSALAMIHHLDRAMRHAIGIEG